MMWGSDSGGKILKPCSSFFQAILAPSKMQFFVCLACLDHFASKKSTCDAGRQAVGEGWFSFSRRARSPNVAAQGKSPAISAVGTSVLSPGERGMVWWRGGSWWDVEVPWDEVGRAPARSPPLPSPLADIAALHATDKQMPARGSS